MTFKEIKKRMDEHNAEETMIHYGRTGTDIMITIYIDYRNMSGDLLRTVYTIQIKPRVSFTMMELYDFDEEKPRFTSSGPIQYFETEHAKGKKAFLISIEDRIKDKNPMAGSFIFNQFFNV